MIIPIRCFTCNKVIANKWEAYKKHIQEKDQNKNDNFTLNDISIKDNEDPMKYFDNNNEHKDFLNKIGIVKMCCVRHFISHVDLIDII